MVLKKFASSYYNKDISGHFACAAYLDDTRNSRKITVAGNVRSDTETLIYLIPSFNLVLFEPEFIPNWQLCFNGTKTVLKETRAVL